LTIRKRLLATAAGLLIAGGLGLTAGAAQAGVSTSPDFTHAGTASTNNPVSGYYATSFGSTFTHVNSYIGLQYASNQISVSPLPGTGPATSGLGDQLCNDNTGTAVQVGAVYVGAGKFALGWTTGTFDATPPAGVTNNNDPCENGLLVNSSVASSTDSGIVSPALDAVPYGDTVEVQIEYNNNGRALSGCPSGDDAEVLGSIIGSNHWYDTCISKSLVPAHEGYNEVADGVEADTTGMSAPADVQLDGNAHFTVTDVAGHHGFADSNANWTAVPVDSTGTGVGPASESLLTPGPIANGNFSQFEGTPTG